MATINSVGTGLAGATGTGSFVGSTSPTLVTPTLGVANSTSLVAGASAIPTFLTTSQLACVGLGTGGISATASYVNSSAPALSAFLKSRSAVANSFVAVQNSDTLGQMSFYADDGTTFILSGRILSSVTASVSTGIVPSSLAFSTMNAAGALTLGMTLTNAQVLTLANALPVTSGGTGTATSTGTGSVVLSNTPTLVTPVLGAATATSINFGGSTLSVYAGFTAWTPVFTFSTPGDLSVVYTIQEGWYSRIGNIVVLQYSVSFTPTFTTSSGTPSLTGVPFASNSTTASTTSGTSSISGTGFTYPVGTTYLVGRLNPGGSILNHVAFGSGSASASIQSTSFVSGVAVVISGTITYSV
jgi:hypothetical protein